jgi:hypothetical protein
VCICMYVCAGDGTHCEPDAARPYKCIIYIQEKKYGSKEIMYGAGDGQHSELDTAWS